MSFAKFSASYPVYDVTPVENLFLMEFMPYAKGDYVRVYLYGLMQCRHPSGNDGLEVIANILNMSVSTVMEAFVYWEQKGLVVRLSDNPMTFEYRRVSDAIQLANAVDDSVYVYGELTKKLEAVFGNLENRYRTAAIEWVEDLGLPTDVVLLMVQQVNDALTRKNGGKQRSVAYVFAALKDCALDWSTRGIKTVQEAALEGEKSLPPYLAARKVLSAFNLRRNPTLAEVTMCAKWLTEWAYTEDQILSALSETTKSANPSFAYVDGILKGRKKRKTASDGDAREVIKEVLTALGSSSRAVTDALMDSYEKLCEKGFSKGAILRAATLCNVRGSHTVEKLDDVLGKWLSLGLTTSDAVDEYLKNRSQLRNLTLRIFDKAGIEREPTDADLEQTREWLEKAPAHMIEYAAECARGLKLPTRSITKRLGEWVAAGISDIEAAREFKRPGMKAAQPGAAPSVSPALNYAQRKYDDSFFDDIFVDLDKVEEQK